MTTVGVYTTHADAQRAIAELRAFGVADADISYIYTNVKGDVTDATSGNKVGSGVSTGAATGAVLGAIAGLVVAEGLLPGLGSLIVAGPLAAALGLSGAAATTVAGAATGLAAGGLIGGLVNLGISQEDASIYQDFIRSGNVLIIAHAANSTRDIFINTGAKQIGQYS